MGRVKALLPCPAELVSDSLTEENFLDRLIGVFTEGDHVPIVVLGYHAAQIQAGIRRKTEFVVNPDPSRGQLSSLRCGLEALPADANMFFFLPVDYPAVQHSTVQRLVEALKTQQDCLLSIPRHHGKRGHPIGCRAELAQEFLQLPADGRASDVIHRHVDRTVYVDVEDRGVLLDVDDQKAYEELFPTRV